MSSLSEQVLSICVEYLGPAARNFLERQTEYHMDNLKLDDLAKEHINDLASWVRISAGLIIDKKKAERLSDRIQELSL